jgi:diguanylate cyclase (GGDEF)-like protein
MPDLRVGPSAVLPIPARAEPARGEPDRDLASARVLLVEDDPLFAQLVEQMLRDAGFVAQAVPLLSEATDILRREELDCILLDLSLPDAHRLEGVEALRKDRPDLPIVVLSGLDDETVAVEAVQRGAQDYLVKGHVDTHIMSRAIRYAIERKQTERALAHLAHHDHLTDLPNRPLFLDRLHGALARIERHPSCIAVLFVDLDRFKEVNDALGHEAGNVLLREIAGRLQTVLRPSDTVARFGGDEFIVLAEKVGGQLGATRLASRICDVVAQPVAIADREVLVTASVGVALARSPLPADDLIRDADSAMYRAKQAGGGYEVYDELDEALSGIGGPDLAPARKLRALRRLETANDLHRALERGELRVFYQPQVELPFGRVAGVEALVRWQHPERGLVGPGEFVPLAEETGLIVPIGQLVLQTACRQAVRWRAAAPAGPALLMSVNLAPRELAEPGLVEDVEMALAESGLEPSGLCLEMTESTVVGHSKGIPQVLRDLKELGVSLRLDDFGTGYSSLAALDEYPVDGVKIDRSFVARLADEERRDVFAAVVGVAHALRLTAIAEGVEEKGQLAVVSGLGCDVAQGNLFAPAGEPNAIEPLLRNAA